MSFSRRVCNLIGPWLCHRLLWWVEERRGTRLRTADTLTRSERDRSEVARRLNLIDLSIRTHTPLAELERLSDDRLG